MVYILLVLGYREKSLMYTQKPWKIRAPLLPFQNVVPLHLQSQPFNQATLQASGLPLKKTMYGGEKIWCVSHKTDILIFRVLRGRGGKSEKKFRGYKHFCDNDDEIVQASNNEEIRKTLIHITWGPMESFEKQYNTEEKHD